MKGIRFPSIQPTRVQLCGNRWRRYRRTESARWRSQKVLPLRLQRCKAKDDNDDIDFLLDESSVDFDDLVLDDKFYEVTLI